MNNSNFMAMRPANLMNLVRRRGPSCDAPVTALLRLAHTKNPMFIGLGTGVTGVTGREYLITAVAGQAAEIGKVANPKGALPRKDTQGLSGERPGGRF